MRALALDWSGASSPAAQRRAIWAASASDGLLCSLVGGFTRSDAVDHVLEELGRGTQLVGLDFSFGFPAWFARSLGADDGPAVWEVAAERGEEWLAACREPFWGRPGRPRPAFGPGREEWRHTELDVPAGGRRPKGTFQIGGAGAVGTASVRGMPHLRRLRAEGAAVWPFDDARASGASGPAGTSGPAGAAGAAGAPAVAEVYPRWATGPVVKRDPAARALHLATLGAALSSADRDTAAACEDAFDAACAAIALSRGGWDLPVPRGADTIEGRILVPPSADSPTDDR